MYRKSPLEYIASGDFFFLGVSFQVGLSVASPHWAVGFTLQSLTLYVQMHEAPGTAEGSCFYSLISLFNNRRYNCYTSVIFRCGRNFSRPTVYCSFFKVGRLFPSLSSYCQPLPLRAAFMAATTVCHIIRADPILLELCQGTELIAT